VPSSCWARCSGFSPEWNGNDFEIDIIMCGVCISRWRFGNANEFRGRGQKSVVGDIGQKRTDADRSGLRRTVSDGYGPKRIIPDKRGQCRTVERQEASCRVGVCGGFAEYWNIKGCARMVSDLNDNFCAVSAICGGCFSAIAPQMRHTRKGGLIT
jgi:hypothetical protein